MGDKRHASLGPYANAGVIAVALLFAACSESGRAPDTPSASVPLQGDDPAPLVGGETLLLAPPTAPLPYARYDEIGVASWYGAEHQGKRTASGARFDMNALTAAHPSLPFGTRLRVENLANGKTIEVRITDRGPYISGRIIDLSMAAAANLDLEERGIGVVGLVILPLPPSREVNVAGTP